MKTLFKTTVYLDPSRMLTQRTTIIFIFKKNSKVL